MSEDVVVTLVNHDSEDLDFPEVRSVKLGGEDDEAESEGDIEIEHLVGEDGTVNQGGDGSGEDHVSNITFDVRKRTLIMLWQRTILEEYYRAGMTSASMQLHGLHQAAAEKTGLDHSVVKNWIRNRRRPAAIKSAERLVEKISQGELSVPYTPPTSLGPLIHSSPSSTVSLAQSRPQAPSHTYPTSQQGLESKRMCLDPILHSAPHTPFPSDSPLISTQHSTPSLRTPPSCPLLIKIRVSGSGESDFYEVELSSPTYETLVKACAEEIEVEESLIARIRKLPNILVRRDRDVLRLKEGQELEVVLKEGAGGGGGGGGGLNVGGFCSSASGLSMFNLTPLTAPSLGGMTAPQHLNGLH